MVLAADRKQAKVVFRYISGLSNILSVNSVSL